MDGVTDLWPMFGLNIATPRLRLHLPRESELGALAQAARVISHPGEPQLHLPWMYDPSPGMEQQFLQRYWRALAHWKPAISSDQPIFPSSRPRSYANIDCASRASSKPLTLSESGSGSSMPCAAWCWTARATKGHY